MKRRVTITFEENPPLGGASVPFSIAIDLDDKIPLPRERCFDHVGFCVNNMIISAKTLSQQLGGRLVYIGWPEEP